MNFGLSGRVVNKSLQTLETKLSTKRYHMDGHMLSDEDSSRWGNALSLWTHLLCDIGVLLRHDDAVTFDRLLSLQSISNFGWSNSFIDVAFLISQIKSLLLVLRRVTPQGYTPQQFKRICHECEVDKRVMSGSDCYIGLTLVYTLLKVVMTRKDLDLVTKARWLKWCNTIIQFPTRITLHDVDWIEDEELQKYVDFEVELKSYTYPQETLRELSEILQDWLCDFQFDANHTDSHGYGATKEVKRSAGTAQKWLVMQTDQCPEHCGLNDLFGVEIHEECEKALDRVFHDLSFGSLPSDRHVYSRYCVYNLVPKGANKKRGVSMEDTCNQFYQKIFFDRLDHHLSTHPYIGVDLHKQWKSTSLCLQASKNHLYGTLDLSSASDSVTWTLVRSIFPSQIVSTMERMRTKWVYIRALDRYVAMEKAFPMGSALCFPIESLTFAAVCELANRRCGVRRKYRVYGDDMIVHRDTAGMVCNLLKELHFQLNAEKSYLPGSSFTEACGIECYEGCDISPLRMSRKFDFIQLSHHQFSGKELARDLANKAFELGYTYLRSDLIRLARRFTGELYFSKEEYAWHSYYCDNQSFKTRYRRSTGTHEVLIRVLRSRVLHDPNAEALRLERWFECRASKLDMVASWMRPEQVTRLLNEEGPGPEVGPVKVYYPVRWTKVDI